MAFSKILIANRGEIACRILRTARALGYRTVAVYSDADASALHVAAADEAVRIGPPPSGESYLSIPAILRAAALTRSEAVHPGYGFLSENADFAKACGRAGLVFVGPTPAAIRAMGNKAAAKRLMEAAGVPCIPGYHGDDQSDQRLIAEAAVIGFPVMVKAAAGGGGRGMRLVSSSKDMPAALSSARSESANAFGSGQLILERALGNARHVEIQVFGDSHGNVIHLGERDCSIQRRHQKVIEESPSPAVTPDLRSRMGAAAVAAAKSIGYRGAGTVEFMLDNAGAFYFMEMNTRLQVEHPVTEAVTGLDLVEWQLRIAQGERLPLEQHGVRLTGHALEARLYAEDPEAGFLPQSGKIVACEIPAAPGVRWDHGLQAGHEVSPDYDPLLAKVIAHGATREEACRRLATALAHTVVLGVPTNRRFLADVLAHPEFVSGAVTTLFVSRYFASGSESMKPREPDEITIALAAVLFYRREAEALGAVAAAWRSTGTPAWPLRLERGEKAFDISIQVGGPNQFIVTWQGHAVAIEVAYPRPGLARITVDSLQQQAHYALDSGTLHLQLRGENASFRETLRNPRADVQAAGDARLLAPMNGKVVAVLAQAGEAVAKGQRVIVLEAMKMQHEITVSRAGVVESIAVRVGEQVTARQLLAELEDSKP